MLEEGGGRVMHYNIKDNTVFLSDQRPSLAEILKKKGYKTTGFLFKPISVGSFRI